MIPVIMCSADPTRFTAAKTRYQLAMADEDWELIHIPDAKSLAEGYNRGIAKSRGDILVFSHDDVEMLAPGIGERLRSHLSRFDLLGIAGTNRLICAIWTKAGPPHIFGQVAHDVLEREGIGKYAVEVFGAPRPVVGGMVALDGVFMAARRGVCDKIRFDEAAFDGFHLYDLDFSYAAYQAGLKVCVACDIPMLHHSGGVFDDTWRVYAERFDHKWNFTQPPGGFPVFQWAAIRANTRAEALQFMRPDFWRK